MLGHIKPPCKRHVARLRSSICHIGRQSSEQFRDLPGSVTEEVTGKARTTPRASDSWPWVLASEIQEEVRGGALSPGSAVLQNGQCSRWQGTTLRLVPAGPRRARPGSC